MLPADITRRIAKDYADAHERLSVTRAIAGLWSTSLNVGCEQLARIILYLAEGRVSEAKNLCTHLMGDPRDVIQAAEDKAGNPGHYFGEPFEE